MDVDNRLMIFLEGLPKSEAEEAHLHTILAVRSLLHELSNLTKLIEELKGVKFEIKNSVSAKDS